MLSSKPSSQFLTTMLFSEDESEANMFGTMSLYIGDITAKKKKITDNTSPTMHLAFLVLVNA